MAYASPEKLSLERVLHVTRCDEMWRKICQEQVSPIFVSSRHKRGRFDRIVFSFPPSLTIVFPSRGLISNQPTKNGGRQEWDEGIWWTDKNFVSPCANFFSLPRIGCRIGSSGRVGSSGSRRDIFLVFPQHHLDEVALNAIIAPKKWIRREIKTPINKIKADGGECFLSDKHFLVLTIFSWENDFYQSMLLNRLFLFTRIMWAMCRSSVVVLYYEQQSDCNTLFTQRN